MNKKWIKLATPKALRFGKINRIVPSMDSDSFEFVLVSIPTYSRRNSSWVASILVTKSCSGCQYTKGNTYEYYFNFDEIEVHV